MEKRIKFPKGMQKKFLLDTKSKANLNWKELSNKFDVNIHSLTKSYLFELCNLPYDLFSKILLCTKDSESKILSEYGASIVKENRFIGRKVLGEQKRKLEKINIKFKERRFKLDNSKIKYSRYDLLRKIKFPEEMNEYLAEEIGMHYGDGFLAESRYEYRLKGNPADEKEYYINYIKPLFKKIYNIDISPRQFNESFGFEIKSKALWDFKSKVLGIKTGEKYSILIPKAIKINNQKILSAFIRGIFDTDGCLYFKSNYGYKRYYPTISISLYSQELIKEIWEILKMLGFNPQVYFYKNYATIHLNGINTFKKYEKLIGWSSQKNLNRVANWKKTYPELDKNMAIVV